MSDHAILSEDDVRTKVVYEWLSGHGFEPSEISLEYSFEIRLGRQVWRVGREVGSHTPHDTNAIARPRTDILVRRRGKSLLVVEVKGPDEQLDELARDQGISYARLVPDIAPYVIVTNGKNSRIFDTITREELTGSHIPIDHRHAQSGFQICLEDLHLRAEAAELFLGLSKDNLLAFCRAQCAQRMSRLRSEDPKSAKKYIPHLYVDRPMEREKLQGILARAGSRVAMVVGRPQVGKTNFICSFIEQRLAKEQPSVFFPAIGLQDSLLTDMSQDFGWILSDSSATAHILVRKLTNVLRRSNSTLVVFVDGWNEATPTIARVLDAECERLDCSEIKIVVSFTHSSAQRLLVMRGNPSYLAESAGIGLDGAGLIEVDPLAVHKQRTWNTVVIDKYNNDERRQAYSRYSEQFKVHVPHTHRKTSDPYLLAAAMRRFAETHLPDSLDEPSLLGFWLNERIRRLGVLHHVDPRSILVELAHVFLTEDAPVEESKLKRRLGIPVTQRLACELFDAALLTVAHDGESSRSIDFYHSRDRDFVIAYWSGRWNELLDTNIDALNAAFTVAARSKAGRSALEWFFQQPEHLRQLFHCQNPFHLFSDPVAVTLLFRGCTSAVLREGETGGIREAVGQPAVWNRLYDLASNSGTLALKIEAVKLMTTIIDDYDVCDVVLPLVPGGNSREEFFLALLAVGRDVPLARSSAGNVILRLFDELHTQVTFYEDADSYVTDFLLSVIHDNAASGVQQAAAAVLGHLHPMKVLELAAQQPRNYESTLSDSVCNAIAAIEDRFYGDSMPLCRCYLDSLKNDPRMVASEYESLLQACAPIQGLLNRLGLNGNVKSLLDTLASLLPPRHLLLRNIRSPDDPRQMHLSFPDSNEQSANTRPKK